jgi:hypothetical protein
MGLQEVGGKHLNASKVEKGDHIQHAKENLDARTFDKICRTIDEAIEDAVNQKTPRLVWLNTGSLVGDRASMPHASHHHLWDAVHALFPSATDPVAVKAQRITVGSLIKWRIALRPEGWLVHYRETDKTDIVSGETISTSEYWIKPAEVVLAAPPTQRSKRGVTVDDLKNRWNKR